MTPSAALMFLVLVLCSGLAFDAPPPSVGAGLGKCLRKRLPKRRGHLFELEIEAMESPSHQSFKALAMACAERGRWHEAADAFEQALKPPFDRDIPCLEGLAIAHALGSAPFAARQALLRLETEAPPLSPPFRLLLAEAEAGLGNFENARHGLENLLQCDDSRWRTRAEIALCRLPAPIR